MIKVLLVDDEMWTRNTIKAFGDWNRFGITSIEEASDGEEGLRLIEENNPHIVITDMNMPGMNGVDLLRIITRKYPHIKLIVISGYDDFEFTREAIKSKAMDYILKPIDAEELNAAIAKCINEINDLNNSKNISLYNLAKVMDKNIIRLIMDEKKVIQKLLIEGNFLGIKNALKRLYDNITGYDIDEAGVGNLVVKVFTVMLEEQLVMVEGIESDNPGRQEGAAYDSENKSLIESFNFIEVKFEKAVRYINGNLKYKDNNTLTQVKSYIEKHYTEHISLDKLSSLFYVSKEYLSKAFKVKFEKNLMNYVIELRMKKAKSMLEDKEISIKNIAESVGYDDITHFYHVFKNYYNASPGDMRK